MIISGGFRGGGETEGGEGKGQKLKVELEKCLLFLLKERGAPPVF